MTDTVNQDTQGAPPAPAGQSADEQAAFDRAAALAAGKPVAEPAKQDKPATAGQQEPKPAEPAKAPDPVTGLDQPKPNEQTASEPDADGAVEYVPTGDARMDLALAFVGKLGITPEHVGMKAAANGDFSVLKAHLATLGDKAKGWEQHVQLAEDSFNAAKEVAEKNTAAITTAVHRTAGGEENWKQIEDWARQNADEKERAEINKLLQGSPVSAMAATLLLRQMFEGAKGTLVTGSNPLTSGRPGAGGAAGEVSPLSPRDYFKAVEELERKEPGSVDANSPAYQRLQQRAIAYKRGQR